MKGAKSQAALCCGRNGNAAKALLRNILDRRKVHQSFRPVWTVSYSRQYIPIF